MAGREGVNEGVNPGNSARTADTFPADALSRDSLVAVAFPNRSLDLRLAPDDETRLSFGMEDPRRQGAKHRRKGREEGSASLSGGVRPSDTHAQS
jgi:hypothetical protein